MGLRLCVVDPSQNAVSALFASRQLQLFMFPRSMYRILSSLCGRMICTTPPPPTPFAAYRRMPPPLCGSTPCTTSGMSGMYLPYYDYYLCMLSQRGSEVTACHHAETTPLMRVSTRCFNIGPASQMLAQY